MQKAKVVLIAGSGHGGTTIANMILGQHPHIFATGKLRDFPHGGLFIKENVCSCGAAADACPFWQEVRLRYRPFQDKADQEKLPRLFHIVSELSGRPFTGDVSHNAGYARQLLQTPDIDLYLVHIVRDGRGVVWSRIRKDVRIGRLNKGFWQRLKRVIKVSRRWKWHIREFGKLEQQLGDQSVRVRYETLCQDPLSALRPVGRMLGLDFDAIGKQLGSGQPFMPAPHLIRGNAVLRTKKDVVLKYDEAFRKDMPLPDRIGFHIASRF
ncbi:MAG: sulfotransferase [gamma proteobacterium symbiont of Bathyaustriella thionipta]|nr:sulfotransferase [gamma proteobacterium symbiont of Bathyaustriella thionipta]